MTLMNQTRIVDKIEEMACKTKSEVIVVVAYMVEIETLAYSHEHGFESWKATELHLDADQTNRKLKDRVLIEFTTHYHKELSHSIVSERTPFEHRNIKEEIKPLTERMKSSYFNIATLD